MLIYLRRQQERGLMQKARRLLYLEQYLEACFVLFLCTGGACAEAKIWRFQWKKKLHKALRSVQFLASFTSFYLEILSYLACGEKIIRLASKNSVKLDDFLTCFRTPLSCRSTYVYANLKSININILWIC